MIIDLHTHTLLSDGALLPAEMIRRAEHAGYKAIALTDHVDSGSIEIVIKQLLRICLDASTYFNIIAIPGVEITHQPPETIPELAKEARALGARLVAVHGESPVEPVPAKTNYYALQSDIDFLAHPGLISADELMIAQKRDIPLELSARCGHSLTNGYLVAMARKYDIKLIINSDAHSHLDLLTPELWRKVGLGAGLSEEELKKVSKNSEDIVAKIVG
jgi:putative hydrolase